MLKGLVALLLLVNLALGAVLAGWLPAPGQDEAEREPARLQRQVRPELLTLTPPGPVHPTPDQAATPGAPASAPASAASAGPSASASGTVGGRGLTGLGGSAASSAVAAVAASAAALPGALPAPGAGPMPAAPGSSAAAAPPASAGAHAGVCLQTSPLLPVQAARLEAALREAGWPGDAWRRVAVPAATRYLVLMGPYPTDELMTRKQRELARRKVAWTELAPGPDLPAGITPGLSLGRHDSEAAAEAALRRLSDRGVRSARVVALPPVAGQALLRLDPVTPAQQARLARLPLPTNASWQSCG